VSAWAAVAAAGSVGAVALVSRRLASTPVSGPLLLVAAGVGCGPVGLDLLDLTRDAEAVKLLLEVALVAVLFTDAAGVRWSTLRRTDALPLRLLGIGLPLTMVLGRGTGPGRRHPRADGCGPRTARHR
jgi:NhaP-type Na+/H+ or K+/H+ antiporter